MQKTDKIRKLNTVSLIRWINTFLFGIGVLIGSILLGTILMILVYCLPTAPMKANVQRSTEIYDYEGVYPQLMWGYKMSQLDNCTDAIMLLNAVYDGSGNAVEDAMQVPRIEYQETDPVRSLINYVNDSEAETYGCAYQRYWHGYLTVLKPLLIFWDVADIRMMNMFLQMALLVYVLYLMLQKRYKGYVPAFLFSILLINPVAIALSFQFSTVYYLLMFSVVFLLKKDYMTERQLLLCFLLLGILTAFFDFLTYPLAALCFPLIFLILKEDSWQEALKKALLLSLAWGIGYIGMWCGKWTIGSILLQQNLWENALARAAEYESMDYNGGKVGGVQVILKNIMVLVKWPILLGSLAVCAHYGKQFVKRHIGRMRWRNRWMYLLPFTGIACIPFVWYLAAGTHSYIHYWFTYRELCISVFALLAGAVKFLSLDEDCVDEKSDITA